MAVVQTANSAAGDGEREEIFSIFRDAPSRPSVANIELLTFSCFPDVC